MQHRRIWHGDKKKERLYFFFSVWILTISSVKRRILSHDTWHTDTWHTDKWQFLANDTLFGRTVQPINTQFGRTVLTNSKLYGLIHTTISNINISIWMYGCTIGVFMKTETFLTTQFVHFWQFIHAFCMFFYYRLLLFFQKLVQSIVIVKI